MAFSTPGKVRISTALSAGETQAITTRKEVVKESLAKLNITGEKIPTVAVLGSGGGLRAMIALYGTLAEMKNQNHLDSTMYLGGVSGSTWCMSELYKHEGWSENIKNLEKMESETLSHGHWDFLKARAATIEAAEDKNYSLTDFWAFFIVYDLLKEMDETKLSEQRESSVNGKNPYPIYAAVDYNRYSHHQPGSWFEFTPHEIGIAGLGASIDSKDFGSKFENGYLKEKKKERIICYLQGLWGSALGSLEEIEKTIYDKIKHLLHHDARRHASREFTPGSHEGRSMELPSRNKPAILLATDVGEPEEKRRRLEKTLSLIFRGAESVNVQPSFTDWAHYIWDTLKCLNNWTWGTTNNFLYNCSEVNHPKLTEEPVVHLVDAGLAINTAYPLILRPEREVELILSFDFSSGDPFETLTETVKYCKANGLRFPEIDANELQDKDNPLDCYIFRGEGAPTVMHFPLFNRVNCPGEVEECRKQFSTFKISYSMEEIQKLLAAATKNVKNVHQKILEEIRRIVDPPSANV
ncbi:cytosolic phospholipase A2 gamma-like [Tiliqua scincoides]|uniref:cytosolic phospholipase A2 gamma-like n=1 Tax=Tiliqua scincoides TaxID=71010 RepID=UPI0034630360